MIRKKNTDLLPELLALAGRVVLDVGCGDGGLTRLMAQHGAHVTGIENNHRQLTRALATPKVAGEHFLTGEAQHLPVGDGTVDVVVFANSLHHVPVSDQPRALEEAARVLRTGGILYVSEPIAEGGFFQVTKLIDDETDVRAKAQEALQAAAQWGLVAERELIHINPVRQRDYDSFRQRMADIAPERDRILADHDASLREAFHSHGRQELDGWHFDQPTKINLLRKARD